MSEHAIHGATTEVGIESATTPLAKRLIVAFLAGFLAVFIAHQAVLAVLVSSGFVSAAAYSTAATAPLGVPQVFSTAFWGGLWGLIFLWAQSRFPRGAGYWAATLVFGAVVPSFVAWFVVAPLKGAPLLAGGDVHRIVTALLVNGAWAVGTGLLFTLARLRPRRA
jgi:hypothetical protein